MFEIGDTLREARVRRDMSIKDAEDALKIRSKYLQALEEEDFEVIPGPTYVKAFLRTYSAWLDLDPEQMIGEYVSRWEPAQDPQRAGRSAGGSSSRGQYRRPGGGGPPSRGRRRQPNYLLVGVIAVVIILVLAIIFRDRGDEPAVIEPDAVSSTTSTLTEEAGGQTGGSASTDTPAGAEDIALVIRAATGPSWLVVKPISGDGAALYENTLAQGEELSFSEPGGFRLSIGAPAAVVLVVNGEEMSVPEPYGVFTLTDVGLQREN
jgi:cytoskeleton protein RodZ